MSMRRALLSFVITATAITGAIGLSGVRSAQADPVTLTASDPIGESSFVSGVRWSDSLPPSAGNDYFVDSGRSLRNVADSTGTVTFGGDSLTLGNGSTAGVLIFKNLSGATVIVNNLTLNNGEMHAGATADGTANSTTLGGSITLGANPSRFNSGAGGRSIIVSAPISGSGSVSFTNGGWTQLTNASNSYTGTSTISGGMFRAADGSSLPTASNLIINGGIFGTETDFTRSFGTGAGQVQLGTGNAGFAAFGATRNVNLDSGATLTWGTAPFSIGTLILSHTTSDATVVLQNPIDFGGATRTIQVNDGSAAIDAEISGLLSGAGGLTRTGAGTLVISGANNTYFGNTTVGTGNGAGVLRATATGALGTGSINFDGSGGNPGPTSRLELTGGISLANPTINLNQRNNTTVAIQSLSGNNTLSGNINVTTGGNQARIQSDADLLTLSGSISTNAGAARNLHLQGAGDGVVSGSISNNVSNSAGTININKEGAGTWTLSGTNTTSGAVNVTGGTLVYSGAHQGNGAFTVSNAGSQLTISGAKTGSGNFTIDSGAGMQLASTGELHFNINNGNTATGRVLGTGDVDMAGLFMLNTSALTDTAGVWNLVNIPSMASASFNPTMFGLQFFGGSSFANEGGGIYTNSAGAGWVFNTATGLLTLGGATLEVWNFDGDGNFGDNANWQDGSAPTAGALVLFGNVITANRTVTLDVPASVQSLSFDVAGPQYTLAGPNTLTLTGGANVTVSAGGNHTISAVIAGTAGLSKSGAGTLNLAGANSYSGTTQVQAGNLNLLTAGAVPGDANVASGAALNFVGDNLGGGYVGGFAGVISGGGSVNINNGADVTFTAANTFTGALNINGSSVLTLSGAGTPGGSDGTAASQTTLAGNQNTSRLQLAGGVNIGNELLILNAREGAGFNAVHLTSDGNNSWAGNIKGQTGGTQYNIESTSGTLTLGGTLSAPDSATRNFVFSGDGNTNITGRIVDLASDADGVPTATNATNNVHVIKRGAGTLTISTGTTNANDYWRGTTVVEQGTLAVDDAISANDGELFTSVIDVRSGATFDVSSFASSYSLQITQIPDSGDPIGQTIRGGGTVKTGAVTLAAWEDSVFTPGDGVGTLTVEGHLTMNQSMANSNGGLNYELSNVTTVGGGANDLIDVTGNLTLLADGAPGGGQFNLRVTPIAGQLATGPYTLMTRGGTTGDTATAADFTISIVNAQGVALNTRQDDGAAVAINPNSVTVTFSPAQSYNWTGAAGGIWDIGATASWSSSDNLYFDIDSVGFSDGTGQTTVNVASAVTPGGVTFNNTVDTYTFTGAGIGVISGATMALNAGSNVILANTGNSLGGNLNVANTATLQHGDGVTTGTSTIGGTVTNAGTIANASGTLNVTGMVNNTGSIAVNGGGMNISGVVSGTGPINVAAGNLTLSGNNTAYDGQIHVSGGSLTFSNTNALGSTAAPTVVSAGATLQSFGLALTVPEPITLNGGNVRVGGGAPAALTLAGDITVGAGNGNFQLDGGTGDDGLTISGNIAGSSGGDLNVGVDGGSRLLVTGAISHNGSLTKSSNGELELQGANTYTGPTLLTGGLLDIEGANATLGLGDVTITGGTLEISSGVLNAIADTAILSITGGIVNLGTGINELIGSLVLDSITQPGGTYNSTTHPTFFAGAGNIVVPGGLPGDHNGDGVVDAADYVLWRKTGVNGTQGYSDWRANFGATSGAGSGVATTNGSSAAVPEPATCALLCLAGSVLLASRRRRASA